MSDESRKKILARRASFIAAALAGVACGKDAAEKAQPCLSVPVNYYRSDAEAEAEAEPQPCLSVRPPDTAAPDAEPVPCLSPMLPPQDAGPPRPCLKVRPPTDAGPPPRPCLSPKQP